MLNGEKMELIAECVDMEVDELTENTILEELDTWDSVAVLSIIAIINEKFERYPNAEEIRTYKTVGDLMEAMQ